MASSDAIRTGRRPKGLPLFRRARAQSHFQDQTGPQEGFDVRQQHATVDVHTNVSDAHTAWRRQGQHLALFLTTPRSKRVRVYRPSNPDYVIDEFEESVPMSTYLVAYMVSDFQYVESSTHEDEVKFRIVARKDAINQTELAKNAGPLVLRYYEDYFDEKFPLSKQDMVAIPDFSAGAMENWGLVTYRYVW